MERGVQHTTRRRPRGVALGVLLAFVLGCDQAPAPSRPGVSGHAPRDGAPPDGLGCPGAEVCVTTHDSALWVLKRGWQHHYRLGLRAPGLEASVARILSEERAISATGHCSLVGVMPELFSASGGVMVEVPPSMVGVQPQPVTPLVANAHLRSEYAFIDLERAESMAWFSEDELARMTRDTFDTPRLRHVTGHRVIDGIRRTLDLLVVFSPESERVYVLERSDEVRVEEYRQRHAEIARADERALVAFVQNLEVPRLSFDAAAACEVPAAFGGSEWMPLRVTQTR